MLNAELFANRTELCRIHCESFSAICEWLTAPGDWIKASGTPDFIERRRYVRLWWAALMFPVPGGRTDREVAVLP